MGRKSPLKFTKLPTTRSVDSSESGTSAGSSQTTLMTAGKLKSKTVSMTQDAAVLAEFQRQEKKLVDRAATSMTDVHQDALRELALFYLHDMRDSTKAMALVPQLDHRRAYNVRVQAIDSNEALTPLQKVEKYQGILAEYPEYRESLEFLIKLRQEEHEDTKG